MSYPIQPFSVNLKNESARLKLVINDRGTRGHITGRGHCMGRFCPSCVRLLYFLRKSTEFHVKRTECWITLITFSPIQCGITSQDKRGSMVAVSDHMVAMSDHIYGIQVCISKKRELENKRANMDLASLSERKDRIRNSIGGWNSHTF